MIKIVTSTKFKVLATFVLFGVFFANLDYDLVRQQLSKLELSNIILAALAIFLQSLIAAGRWFHFLAKITDSPSTFRTLNIYLSSVFVNQILPASVGGDAVRAVMIQNKFVSFDEALASIIIERVVMLMTLLAIICIQQVFLLETKFFPDDFAIFLTFSIVAICITLWFLIRFSKVVSQWKTIQKIFIWHQTLVLLIKERCFNFSVIIFSSLLAYVGVLAFCGAVYIISDGFGISLNFYTACLIGPSILLASTLPISIGGWGVREGATATLFILIGLDLTEGIMVGLCLSVVTMLAALPGGFSLIFSLGLNPFKLKTIQSASAEKSHRP